MKLISLGVSTEIVSVFEKQHSRGFSIVFAKEIGSAQTANPCPHNYQVVRFSGVLWFAGTVPESPISQTVRNFERTGMTAAHTGSSRWVVSDLILWFLHLKRVRRRKTRE